MRIAISGTHATGKSTLAIRLAKQFPSFTLVEEPYHALAAEGHVFPAAPGPEDFEMLLERSLEDFAHFNRNGVDVLFDRSPADYLAYLAASGVEAEQTKSWVPRVGSALASLNVLLFVPIERPDRFTSVGDHPRLRRRVDAILRGMVLEDDWGLGVGAREVTGKLDDRVEAVLRHLKWSDSAGKRLGGSRRAV